MLLLMALSFSSYLVKARKQDLHRRGIETIVFKFFTAIISFIMCKSEDRISGPVPCNCNSSPLSTAFSLFMAGKGSEFGVTQPLSTFHFSSFSVGFFWGWADAWLLRSEMSDRLVFLEAGLEMPLAPLHQLGKSVAFLKGK